MVQTFAERQKHLMDAFRTLMKRKRDWMKKGRGYNEFCKLLGGFYSYENTYNEKQKNGIRIYTSLVY